MQNRGGKDRIRAGQQRLCHVFGSLRSPRGDHRHPNRTAYCLEEFEVIPRTRTIAVPAREKDFASAGLDRRTCPLDNIEIQSILPLPDNDPPAISHSSGIECQDGALASELGGHFA